MSHYERFVTLRKVCQTMKGMSTLAMLFNETFVVIFKHCSNSYMKEQKKGRKVESRGDKLPCYRVCQAYPH